MPVKLVYIQEMSSNKWGRCLQDLDPILLGFSTINLVSVSLIMCFELLHVDTKQVYLGLLSPFSRIMWIWFVLKKKWHLRMKGNLCWCPWIADQSFLETCMPASRYETCPVSRSNRTDIWELSGDWIWRPGDVCPSDIQDILYLNYLDCSHIKIVRPSTYTKKK